MLLKKIWFHEQNLPFFAPFFFHLNASNATAADEVKDSCVKSSKRTFLFQRRRFQRPAESERKRERERERKREGERERERERPSMPDSVVGVGEKIKASGCEDVCPLVHLATRNVRFIPFQPVLPRCHSRSSKDVIQRVSRSYELLLQHHVSSRSLCHQGNRLRDLYADVAATLLQTPK